MKIACRWPVTPAALQRETLLPFTPVFFYKNAKKRFPCSLLFV
jgi:hypothetical protein